MRKLMGTLIVVSGLSMLGACTSTQVGGTAGSGVGYAVSKTNTAGAAVGGGIGSLLGVKHHDEAKEMKVHHKKHCHHHMKKHHHKHHPHHGKHHHKHHAKKAAE